MKLLIVDDHAGVRTLIRELTSALTSEVRECGAGEQALRECAAFRPDCVVTDLRLPDMSGLELIERLRLVQPATRVIAVTRSDHPRLRNRALAAGADTCLPKHSLVTLRDYLLVWRAERADDACGAPE